MSGARSIIVVAAVALACAAAIAIFPRNRGSEEAPSPPVTPPVPSPALPVAAAVRAPVAPTEAPSAQANEQAAEEEAGGFGGVIGDEPAPTVRIGRDSVLATVNGQPIRVDELVPIPDGRNEAEMTEAEYESRLERAIEARLTFDAARARGIELDDAQKGRVEQLRQRHGKELESLKKEKGVQWSSVSEKQIEFQARLASALMLQQSLVAADGGGRPSPNRDEQASYEAARSALLARLRAEANVQTNERR